MNVYMLTDPGLKRSSNQDTCACHRFSIRTETPEDDCPSHGCWGLVCDGMGGMHGGDIASETASNIIQEKLKALETQKKLTESSIKKVLREAFALSNNAIRQFGFIQFGLTSGMGTTAVAAFCIEERIVIANVGDSRAYLIRGNTMRQVTVDHSLVQEMVRKGDLLPEAALYHPQKNVITRALGADSFVNVDLFTEDFHVGDTLLLCSDGLTNYVDDEDILSILTRLHDKPEEAVQTLVDEANKGGGGDNITTVLIVNRGE